MKRLPARWNLAKTTKSEKREILKKISEELNSPNPKTPDMKDDFWRVIMLAMDENNRDCASLIKMRDKPRCLQRGRIAQKVK